MLYFSTISNLKLRTFFGKIGTVFREIDPQFHKFWLSDKSSKKYVQKILKQHYCRFLQDIWVYMQREDGENTTSIWYSLKKDMKAVVHSPDGDTDFFDIVTGVLH